jgi:hypothetical protein
MTHFAQALEKQDSRRLIIMMFGKRWGIPGIPQNK